MGWRFSRVFLHRAVCGCGLCWVWRESEVNPWCSYAHSRSTKTFSSSGVEQKARVSRSTPEAEIVAADMLWQQLGAQDPNFVFYDDSQTMIGVIRAGKNPTSHDAPCGVVGCIASSRKAMCRSRARSQPRWLRTHTHTKSFKDSVCWTHACQLINIFPPALIGSQEIMDLMRPTHPLARVRRAIKITHTPFGLRCLISPIRRRRHCLRCCVLLDSPTRKVYRSTTASIPFWLSSSRACCGNRLRRCRRVVIFFSELSLVCESTVLVFGTGVRTAKYHYTILSSRG